MRAAALEQRGHQKEHRGLLEEMEAHIVIISKRGGWDYLHFGLAVL